MNQGLVLDAGSYEQISTTHGLEWLIRPPQVSMFHQVVNYLGGKPEPAWGAVSKIAREGVATAHGESPADDGFGSTVFDIGDVSGHGEYFNDGTRSLINIARIAAGKPPL